MSVSFQGIGTDTHVAGAAAMMGWTEATNVEQVRKELESWVPKMFWDDFNEVFGCLGQMAKKKELQPSLRNYLSRKQFESIADPVRKLIDSYKKTETQKRKAPPKTNSKKRKEPPYPAFD